MPISAYAVKEPTVEFTQYTYEVVPGMSQSLRGVDSFMDCGNGNIIAGPLFDLSATRDGSSSSGSWTMIAAPGAAAGDAGSIEKAQIGVKQFRIKGQWDNFGRENSIVCYGTLLPIDFTLKGRCGMGVNIELTTSTGIKGSFKGDVNCS